MKSININMKAFGAEFANMDSDMQTDFFTGLGKELLTWETNHLVEMQFLSIGQNLSPNVKQKLKYALRCLWYEEEEANSEILVRG